MMKIAIPPKFRFLHKKLKNKTFTLLDVGCGNHSSSMPKYWFPRCSYYGLDKDKNYNNTEEDIKLMDGLYETDLTNNDLQEVRIVFLM